MVDVILGCCRGDDLKPKVTLQIGKIIGSARETSKGTEYVSFVGIPYAEPPIGILRFQPPVPASVWSCVLDARESQDKVCPQVLYVITFYMLSISYL